jgi:amino acid transporter
VESASIAAGGQVPAGSAPGDKGLKPNAIGYVSNLVISVASTAPGYSLAATLGFIAAVSGLGLQSPAVLLVSFIPMLFIAAAYKYMNRADPDCGTTFSWVTRAMGPQLGWLGGWAIIVADVIVMANLAQIAGTYTFLLFDWTSAAASVAAVTAVGVVWIVVMTAICYIGIELSARTQVVLLTLEVVALAAFAVVALVKVYTGNPPGHVNPTLSWLNPFEISSFGALASGVLLGVFIYWGWDSGVTVNEESRDSSEGPGKAAILSTVILLLIYVIVGIAAQAYGGTKPLVDHSDDVLSFLGAEVFGSPFDKILIIAVLTSAAASTQTTILPTARTSLSMARSNAFPKMFGRIHPRYLTPSVSTVLMGAASVVWYVVIVNLSTHVLADSITALGFMIAFYYGLTGFACVIYYRRELFKSVKNFVYVGLAPLLGGGILFAIFIKALTTYKDPANTLTKGIAGIGTPVVIGVGGLVLGIVLMLVSWIRYPEFFRRRPEVADPAVLAEPPPAGRGA